LIDKIHSMKFAVVLLALVALAIAQGPTFSDSFTGAVDFIEKTGSTSRSFHGTWYFDFIGRQERFVAATTRGVIQFFRFYNISKEYEYSPKSDFCKSNSARARFFGIFDWLKNSATKANGQCKQNITSGATGNAWQLVLKNSGGLNIQLDFCVDTTGKIPYWEELKGTDNGNTWFRGVLFSTYAAGTPPSSTYQLPDKCKQ